MQPQPPEGSYDLDRTDTLPVLALDAGDTGTLAVPQVPEAQLPRRLRVADDLYAGTDSFTAATLAGPIAALPVSVPDLAESLREREELLAGAARREEELQALLEQAGGRMRELDAQREQGDRRCAELESQLARMKQRCVELEQQATARDAPAASPAPVAVPSALIEELGALRRTNTRLHESLSSLHGRLGVHEAMLAEAEEELRNIETGVRAALPSAAAIPAAPVLSPSPSDAPLQVDWASRYAELELMLEGEREAAASRLAAMQAELAAARAHSAPAGGAASTAARGTGAGIAKRVLIRMENGAEFIHPLGRRTTIGRTPDNDIQVDTTYISRHHAALLSSAGECIVEDLNSTNGLLVNGQRVGRRILQHGDLLVVGKTHFRYESRS